MESTNSFTPITITVFAADKKLHGRSCNICQRGKFIMKQYKNKIGKERYLNTCLLLYRNFLHDSFVAHQI